MRSSVNLEPATILTCYEDGQSLSAVRQAGLLLGLTRAADAIDDPWQWSLGARDAALLALRTELFGSKFESVGECTACDCTIEVEFNAESLFAPVAAHGTVVAIRQDEIEFRARLPNGEDLLAIEGMPSVEAAADLLLERCLIAPAGGRPRASARAELAAAMAQADSAGDLSLQLTCPECETGVTLEFDVGRYLWAELESWAEDALDDVHAIGSAYGWAESDILALSPARRRAYLERLVGA